MFLGLKLGLMKGLGIGFWEKKNLGYSSIIAMWLKKTMLMAPPIFEQIKNDNRFVFLKLCRLLGLNCLVHYNKLVFVKLFFKKKYFFN